LKNATVLSRTQKHRTSHDATFAPAFASKAANDAGVTGKGVIHECALDDAPLLRSGADDGHS